MSGILGANGKVYGLPVNTGNVLEINLSITIPFSTDVAQSAYFDKF